MRRALIPIAAVALLPVPADADAPRVVTDTPVVHSLVSQVMGDLGPPSLMLDRGEDAHDFQLRPSQLRALQGADLIVWVGPELTPWLDRALDAVEGPRSLELLHESGTHLLRYGMPPKGGHDDLEEGTQDIREDHGHEHAGTDPHAWLDLDNAELWLGAITDALVEQDPGNAVAYRANATLALSEIAALDETIRDDLAAADPAPIVVAHDAYAYFADHFGLTIAASLAEGDAADPGAAHMSHVRELLETGEVACVFPEAARDPAPVLALAEGTDIPVGGALDPEGREIEPGAMLYQQLLQAMGSTIAACLSGK